MPDENFLLAAVAANPHDDRPRLAYAAWLEENGDAIPGRDAQEMRDLAEFIRVQMALARPGHTSLANGKTIAELETRQVQLLSTYRKKWEQPVRDKFPASERLNFEFNRGFLDGISIRASTKNLRIIAGMNNFRSLELNYPCIRRPQIEIIADMSHLQALRMSYARLTSIEALAKMQHLESLVLYSHSSRPIPMGVIARMSGLRSLDLQGSWSLNKASVRAIAGMANLEALCLCTDALDERGAQVIAESPNLQLSAKLMGLESAGYGELAARVRAAATNQAPGGDSDLPPQPQRWRKHLESFDGNNPKLDKNSKWYHGR